jgi:hypothetical protein
MNMINKPLITTVQYRQISIVLLTINHTKFILEFVSKPNDESNTEEGQQTNDKSKIFHFDPLGVHVYIQVIFIQIYFGLTAVFQFID